MIKSELCRTSIVVRLDSKIRCKRGVWSWSMDEFEFRFLVFFDDKCKATVDGGDGEFEGR